MRQTHDQTKKQFNHVQFSHIFVQSYELIQSYIAYQTVPKSLIYLEIEIGQLYLEMKFFHYFIPFIFHSPSHITLRDNKIDRNQGSGSGSKSKTPDLDIPFKFWIQIQIWFNKSRNVKALNPRLTFLSLRLFKNYKYCYDQKFSDFIIRIHF